MPGIRRPSGIFLAIRERRCYNIAGKQDCMERERSHHAFPGLYFLWISGHPDGAPGPGGLSAGGDGRKSGVAAAEKAAVPAPLSPPCAAAHRRTADGPCIGNTQVFHRLLRHSHHVYDMGTLGMAMGGLEISRRHLYGGNFSGGRLHPFFLDTG